MTSWAGGKYVSHHRGEEMSGARLGDGSKRRKCGPPILQRYFRSCGHRDAAKTMRQHVFGCMEANYENEERRPRVL
jgi:hypothetical protein